MADLSAGTTVYGEDTPPTVGDEEAGQFTFNATTYGMDVDSGTGNDCGVAFIAPTTGRVRIDYAAQLDNDTALQGTSLAPVVRQGGTVGTGVSVLAASDVYRLLNIGTDAGAWGSFCLVTGLVAGDTYNVRLEHKVSGGIGTILNRRVAVNPCT